MIDRPLARRIINRVQKLQTEARYGVPENREKNLEQAISTLDLLYDVLHLDEDIKVINIH